MGEQRFSNFIEEHDAGRLNDDLSTTMEELLNRLQKRAGISGTAKGEITLKLAFAVGENGRTEIEATTTVKQPGPPKSSDTKWVTSDGELVGNDPRQQKLNLKTPAANDAPLKTPGRN